MCGSSTTTTVETGQLSDRGQSYDDLYSELMMDHLNTYGGYDIVSVQKTSYQDQGKADSILSKIETIDAQLEKFGAEGDSNFAQMFAPKLKAQKAQLEQELAGMKHETYNDFEFKKKEDPRIQDAIDKYGADSPQVQQVKQQIKQQEVDKAYSLADVEKNYLSSLQKLAAGDYSYTPEQAAQIGKFIDPIKGVIEKTSSDLLTQYGASDKELRNALDGISKSIDQTGFDVTSALQAANVQFEQSGKNLMGILDEVTSSANAKAKFEFDLLSQQADTQAAQQAALLGMPPGSMSEKLASQKMKTDALQQIELNLALNQASGKLQIQGGVESGKQQISLSKVALAESQGGKKEDVAKMGFGLTQDYMNKIEGVIGNKGNALTQLEQQKQNMLYGAAYGNLPGQIAAAQGGLMFDTQQKAGQVNLQNALMSPLQQQLSVEQQRQLAETTTTQKQKKGFIDSFTEIAGGIASLAGAGMGIGGMIGGGGGASGGGGGFAPSNYGYGGGLDLNVFKPVAQGSPFHFEY